MVSIIIPSTSQTMVMNETANANLPINFFKEQSYNVIFMIMIQTFILLNFKHDRQYNLLDVQSFM